MAHSILLVGAETLGSSPIQQLLHEAGYRIKTASCFEEASHELSVDRPDLVITALRLGPYNGLHLALRCRTLQPGVPVLVIGGPDDRSLAGDAAHLGARFLSTTTEATELLTTVGTLIARGVHTDPT